MAYRRVLATGDGEPALRAGALVASARTNYMAQGYATAIDHLAEAAALYRSINDPHGLATALVGMGHSHLVLTKSADVAARSRHLEAAEASFREQLPLGERLGDARLIASASRGIGNVMLHRGDHGQAVMYLTVALASVEVLGKHNLVGWVLRDLGIAVHLHGGNRRAAALLKRSIEMFQSLEEDPWTMGQALKTVSLVAFAHGNTIDGVRLHGAASALLDDYGLAADVAFRLDDQAMIDAIRTIGDGADSPWTVGKELSVDEAIALSLSVLDKLTEDPPGSDQRDMQPADASFVLTGRERDVLRLLANGQSDREIARELSISPHTVHGHVSNLLGKLGVTSRTAAAVAAHRHGLV